MNLTRYIILTAFLYVTQFVSGNNDSSVEKEPYDKIVNTSTISKTGLFTTHEVNNKLYFEIPLSVLNKDMLIAVRVAEVSENNKVEAGRMMRNPELIRFTNHEGKIFIRMPQSQNVLGVGENELIHSFRKNNIDPIMAVFDIEAWNPDSSACLINVTKFFTDEIPYVGPFNDKFKPGRKDAEACYIDDVQTFENNVEIATYLSYHSSRVPFLVKLNRSIVLLPDDPMRMRLNDPRVGYYDISKRIYNSNSNRLESYKFIKKWRLEPKKEDLSAFLNGELVEPEKPIVFYIDKAFPESLKKYIIEGVECWQPAFEAIGFKNAITAKEYPDNPDFNPDDIRYSCIRYITSNNANAMGPSWIDPRTGEIIQAEVMFYHNVLKLIHDWRFVQTAAVDEAARKKVFSEELMGELVRYVIAHEIGHTLGQEHNMRGSYAYPVDSLRSPSFTAKYGSTASIMDYARNNYVAQPGDGVEWLSPPKLGPYDYFSIQYAYKPIPEASSYIDEKAVLQKWITDKNTNPLYIFGAQSHGLPIDPASQQEALGDDAIYASELGIKNLKYIMNHLVEWTATAGDDYSYTTEIYKEITKQYMRYMFHATVYIGGANVYPLIHEQEDYQYESVPKSKQKEALNFIFENLIDVENWLISKEIENVVGFERNELLEDQLRVMDWLVNPVIFGRFHFYGNHIDADNEYTIEEYLSDIHKQIVSIAKSDDEYTRTEMMLLSAYAFNMRTMISNHMELPEAKEDLYSEMPTLNNVSQLEKLERSESSKKLKFYEINAEALLLTQYNKTKNDFKKLSKKGNRKNRQFLKYLYGSM